MPAAAQTELVRLASEIDALKKTPAPPLEFANGRRKAACPAVRTPASMTCASTMRGRYDRLGDLVPRHFPEILAGDDADADHHRAAAGCSWPTG